MPTEIHEALVQFLFLALYQFVEPRKLGKVYSSGIRVQIRPQKIRMPDVVFLHTEHFEKRHNRIWQGIDLTMEVVSEDSKDRLRDYQQKLADYAEAQVAEYWIVDPELRKVVVFQLRDGQYVEQGEFSPGAEATSLLLTDFKIDVRALFAVIDDIPK